MKFDFERPTIANPYIDGDELKWQLAKDTSGYPTYYFWSQPVPVDVSFLNPPIVIDCEHGNFLEVCMGQNRVELLYRLTLVEKPKRFLTRPYDHTIFWTYGAEGGPSGLVKYLFRDKCLSVHKWEDKDSFLSVIRTNHYANYDYAFWSR